MAKKIYIGVGDVARNVKKIYIGVDGIARRVKKAYIGIGGVARPILSNGLEYYGTISGLSATRHSLAATSIGDYALFGGGSGGSSKAVDAYNKSLTRSTLEALSAGRMSLAATSIGDYALFGGGHNYVETTDGGYTKAFSTVDAYNKSLTRSTPTALSVARTNLAATSIGDYALFGGGYTCTTDLNLFAIYSNTVDAYNKSLTRSTPTALRFKGESLAATSIGDYALFGGGHIYAHGEYGSYETSTVDAYNKSLTRSTLEDLSVARRNLDATSIGDYALFGGGYNLVETTDGRIDKPLSTVDAYDKSLTRSTPTALSVARTNLAATSIGDYALFGGGHNYVDNPDDWDMKPLSTVDAYDKSLTRSTPTALSDGRTNLAATSIGDYALFGGGNTTFLLYTNIVDAYLFSN